ncbi:hypothetical protein [Mesorhizobium sp. M0895]|uniref:hypothetical protein n=1 Tax=Mesorhizobium sp. M0895 TaxID=2957019 RepID=UPI00333CEC35
MSGIAAFVTFSLAASNTRGKTSGGSVLKSDFLELSRRVQGTSAGDDDVLGR